MFLAESGKRFSSLSREGNQIRQFYCIHLLLSYGNRSKRGEIFQSHVGKRSWASSGQYIERAYLRAFVDSLGHQWDHLLEHGRGDDNGVALQTDLTDQFQLQKVLENRPLQTAKNDSEDYISDDYLSECSIE